MNNQNEYNTWKYIVLTETLPPLPLLCLAWWLPDCRNPIERPSLMDFNTSDISPSSEILSNKLEIVPQKMKFLIRTVYDNYHTDNSGLSKNLYQETLLARKNSLKWLHFKYDVTWWVMVILNIQKMFLRSKMF